MYNAPVPSRSELPTSVQLVKSTFFAIVIAMLVLVTVVLPVEYGIDPTGAGHLLGLTEMGEIRSLLAR